MEICESVYMYIYMCECAYLREKCIQIHSHIHSNLECFFWTQQTILTHFTYSTHLSEIRVYYLTLPLEMKKLRLRAIAVLKITKELKFIVHLFKLYANGSV